MATQKLDQVISLAKRRGFVFQAGEIYGGSRSAWDYGPLGVELKENIKRQWWQAMVTGRDDVRGVHHQLGLAVIEDQEIDALEETLEFVTRNLDPEVHRVSDREGRSVAELIDHGVLVERVGVGEQVHRRGGFLRLGHGGLPGFEHIESDRERFAVVHVLHVFARPTKGLAVGEFDPLKVDVPLLEEIEVFDGEVVSHDGDHADRGKETGSDGGVGGGTAEQVLLRGFLRFDIVDGDGTGDEDAHEERMEWWNNGVVGIRGGETSRRGHKQRYPGLARSLIRSRHVLPRLRRGRGGVPA